MGQATATTTTTMVSSDDDERVHEWEDGLPNMFDITPLTQGLIPPELITAFNIRPEPHRTTGDVNRASEDTISSIRGHPFNPSAAAVNAAVDAAMDGGVYDGGELVLEVGEKVRRGVESPEDADSAAAEMVEEAAEGEGGKAAKRARLVWTPQLHRRFVDTVGHLGIKNAVPKTIMQLMNVEGLTRENVASHLQKYRLYLKRQGGSFDDGPSGVAPSSKNNNHNSNGNGSGNSSGSDGNNKGSNGNGNGNGSVSGGGEVPVKFGGHMMPVPMMGYNGYEGFHQNNHYNNYNGYNFNQNQQQQQQGMQYGNGMMMMPMQQQSGSGNISNSNGKYGGGMMSYHHHNHNHFHQQHSSHVGPSDS